MNPHPPLTGFPPVIAVLLLAYEGLCYKFPSLDQRSFRLLLNLALTIFTALTYFSGFFGREIASPDLLEGAYVATHEGYARMALILACLQLLLLALRELAPAGRRGIGRGLYLINLVAVCGMLWYTATLGGELVFDHGMGVERAD